MRITYIAEGSKDLGMGHLIHQGAMVEALKWRLPQVKQNIVIIDALHPGGTDWAWGAKVVLCNCLQPNHYLGADVIVTPDISEEFENKVTYSGGATWFKGPRYWFLRKGFGPRKDTCHTPIHEWPEPIGIMIGGMDANGLAPIIQRELSYLHTYVIRSKHPAAAMRGCKLMITGCGLGFWESLAVGTPAIPIAQNEAQAAQYGSVFKLGELDNLREMIEKREWVNPDPKWEIGQGTDEVIEEILW